MPEKHGICRRCKQRIVWSSRQRKWLHIRPLAPNNIHDGVAK